MSDYWNFNAVNEIIEILDGYERRRVGTKDELVVRLRTFNKNKQL